MLKKFQRAILGSILGFGAPLGWLLIQWLSGVDLSLDLKNNIALYSYMLFGTILVFTLFGYYLGKQEDQLELLSYKDPLTGLKNRRYFTERLQYEMEHAKRKKTEVSIILFDLDDFKKINDTYGHTAGDITLKSTSDVVSKACREYEIICRVGGEEFAILLPELGVDDAEIIAERIRDNIEKQDIKIDDSTIIHITSSIGVSCCTKSYDPNKLFSNADSALYIAKESGKNKISTLLP